MQKTVLKMRSDCLEWNPMEPMNFVVGNEDYNAYSFDMRKLDKPTMIYKDMLGLFLQSTGLRLLVENSSLEDTIKPLGSFLVARKGKAREVYHTKRMQRIFTLNNYTADNRYVISGSDDTNVRLWKANASEKIGQMLSIRERHSLCNIDKLLSRGISTRLKFTRFMLPERHLNSLRHRLKLLRYTKRVNRGNK